MDEIIERWGGERQAKDEYLFPSPGKALKCKNELEEKGFDEEHNITHMQDVLYVRER